MDDSSLLTRYVEYQSDEAFDTLVQRHVDLVYSSALRQSADPHLAEDITQAVFIALSRHASKLRPGTILPAWLLSTTRLAASNARRTRENRTRFEAKAAQMKSQTIAQTSEAGWSALAPHLDDAIAELNAADRAAVVVRFFERRTLADTGRQLGISEDAAEKRVSRALERMRRYFAKRGLQLTVIAIASVLSSNAIHAAPPAIAASVSAALVASKAGALSASALALTEAIKFTALAHFASLAASVVLAIAVTAAVSYWGWSAIQARAAQSDASAAAALDLPEFKAVPADDSANQGQANANEGAIQDAENEGSVKGVVIYDAPRMQTLPINVPARHQAECGCTTVPNEALIVAPGTKTLKNAIVRVLNTEKFASTPPQIPATPSTISFKNCQLVPHVTVVAPNTSITISNLDKTVHNAHTVCYDLINPDQNIALPPRMQLNYKAAWLAQPEIIECKCDIHPWERCFIVVHDPRYCAVTGADGKFEIKKLPAGKHTLHVFHERGGASEMTVEITAGKTADLGDVVLPKPRGAK